MPLARRLMPAAASPGRRRESLRLFSSLGALCLLPWEACTYDIVGAVARAQEHLLYVLAPHQVMEVL
jgi:hypothetical protein